jgi:uncharacterized membrane protein
MNEEKLKKDVEALRERVKDEDQLLISRTSIVLTLNGLMAIATGISLPDYVRLTTAIVIILINVFWIVCALDAQNFIHSLIGKISESNCVPIDEKVRNETQKNRFRIGSTWFISFIVPLLLLLCWILCLGLTIGNFKVNYSNDSCCCYYHKHE